MVAKHIAVSGDHDDAASNTAPRFFDRSKVFGNIGVREKRQHTGGAGHNADRCDQPGNIGWGDRRAISDDQFNAPLTAGSGGDNREGVLLAAHQVSISQGAKRSRNGGLITFLHAQSVGDTPGHTGKGGLVSTLRVGAESQLQCGHRCSERLSLALGGVEGVSGLSFGGVSLSQHLLGLLECFLKCFGHGIGGLS